MLSQVFVYISIINEIHMVAIQNDLPSRIFCSNSSNVGSMSSHPSGGGFLLLLTFGIVWYKLLSLTVKSETAKQKFENENATTDAKIFMKTQKDK